MRFRLLALVLPLFCLSPATHARPDDPLVIEALTQLQADDVRLATIAYRIAVASADICPVLQPLPGVVVHDLGQYNSGYREGVVRLFGAPSGIAIEGLVPGSPAELAGLKPNDRLIAVDGTMLDHLQGDSDHLPMVLAAIEAAMAKGSARFTVVRDGKRIDIDVGGVPGCASRVEIRASTTYNGWADGVTAQLSSAMVDFTRDDDELATVIAHEMSHNILRHRERLNAAGISRGIFGGVGRSARLVRMTEMEADRLAVYLIARAGYDPNAAARFWDRLLDQHGAGVLADGTHLGRRQQVALVTGVAQQIAALRAAGQPLMPPVLKAPLPPLD